MTTEKQSGGWNNRVLIRHDETGTYYALHETYYDETGEPHSCTSDDLTGWFDSVEELIDDLERKLRDARKYKDDPLEYSRFEKGGDGGD